MSTVLAGIAPGEADQDWTGLFHSPIGLFPFQAEHTARSYLDLTTHPTGSSLVLWDTGLGKTVMAIATAALLVEDDLVDQVVVVAEQAKVVDWVEDLAHFSRLEVARYAGPPARRAVLLEQGHQVLVMTYETGRNDICSLTRTLGVGQDKMLTTYLRGRRTLVVFDEFSKLRTRKTALYTSWDYLLNRVLRRDPGSTVMVQALTATSVERHPEDHWNAGRLIAPEHAGSVAWMKQTYIGNYDAYGNPTAWKNLSAERVEDGVTPMNRLFAEITLRKNKNDPDVREHFPAMVENRPTMVSLGDAHTDLYERVQEMFTDPGMDDQTRRSGFGLVRLIADHPQGLLRAQGRYARSVVGAVGAQALVAMGSAKADAMLAWQHAMGDQSTVVFTFYGQTVLPLLAEALRHAGYAVSVNHGQLSPAERQAAQDSFKAGDTQIFLSSDAGARGLNLGIGSGMLHYEAPLLYSVFTQRSNRIHRIDSVHSSVTVDTLVAQATVEMPIMHNLIRSNRYTEQIQDEAYTEETDPGEAFLSASDRLAMFLSSHREHAA